MRSWSSLSLCLAAAVLASGCYGFSPVRLVEVETRRDSGVTTKEITYADDGRIDEIETRSGGDFVGSLEFIWDGGRLTGLEYRRASQEDLDIALHYEGSRLVRMEADEGGVAYSIELEYENDDPSFLEEHELVVQQGNSRTTVRRTVEYDEGRAVAGKETSTYATGGGSVTVSSELELKWGKDGLPEEIELTGKAFGITTRREAEYIFADDGTLEEVEYDDDERVELSYDDRGRIEEIEITEDDGDRVVYELKYEDGNQSGFAFVAPGLPANQLFDLTGRAKERPEVFTDAWFPMP